MKGIYYNDLPEEYPQGYVKEKATIGKPLCINGISSNLCSSILGKDCVCEIYKKHVASIKTHHASGFNVPSGTDVEYELQPTWYKNCDRSVPTLDDIKDFAIPSKAVEGKEEVDPHKVAIEVVTENRRLRLLLAEATGLTHGESIETYKKYLKSPPVTDKQQERLYPPEEVLKMVEDAFESGAQYAYNVAMGLEQTEPNRNQYVDDLKKKMGIE